MVHFCFLLGGDCFPISVTSCTSIAMLRDLEKNLGTVFIKKPDFTLTLAFIVSGRIISMLLTSMVNKGRLMWELIVRVTNTCLLALSTSCPHLQLVGCAVALLSDPFREQSALSWTAQPMSHGINESTQIPGRAEAGDANRAAYKAQVKGLPPHFRKTCFLLVLFPKRVMPVDAATHLFFL